MRKNRNKLKLSENKGLTLVELLITIAILAILAVAIIPSVLNDIQPSKEKEDVAWGDQVANVYVVACQDSHANYFLEKNMQLCDAKTIVFTYNYIADTSSGASDDEVGLIQLKDIKYLIGSDTSGTNRDAITISGITASELSKVKAGLEEAETCIMDYVNSTVEPYYVRSAYYKGATFTVKITLGERDFLVSETHEWTPKT